MNRSSTHTPRYAYWWSARVINDFIDSYGRATYFVAKVLGLDCDEWRETLIQTLMRGGYLWERLREGIKCIERQDMYDEIMALPVGKRKEYLTFVTLHAVETQKKGKIDAKVIDWDLIK